MKEIGILLAHFEILLCCGNDHCMSQYSGQRSQHSQYDYLLLGHIQGIHYQNEQNFESYDKKIATREVPAYKTLALTQEERLIRELILQLKLGHVSRCYFQKKFQIEIYQRFSRQLHLLRKAGLLNWDKENLTLTRLGLLQVDFILPEFFLPRHRNAGNTL